METVREGTSVPSTVLNISAGPDTGGQMIRTKRAFDRLSGWSMRAVVHSESFMHYGTDLRWDRKQVEQLWADADVVHVHRQLKPFMALDQKVPKPLVVHHHGTAFRAQSEELLRLARQIGAVNVVSTLDLLRFDPQATWLPSPFDVDWLASLRKPNRSTMVRIVHAPTNRKVKSTDLITSVVKRLARQYPIEFSIIEGRPWAECLAAKAQADLVIDQLVLGYGNNALEAWGMGIPVVAGADPEIRALMVDRLGELPFYEASPDDLYRRLEPLVADSALRREYGRRGQSYVRQWHSEASVVRQLEGLYARAIVERKSGRMFVASAGKPLHNRLRAFEVRPGVFLRMTPAMAQKRGLSA